MRAPEETVVVLEEKQGFSCVRAEAPAAAGSSDGERARPTVRLILR
jgi:hypothetical protein